MAIRGRKILLSLLLLSLPLLLPFQVHGADDTTPPSTTITFPSDSDMLSTRDCTITGTSSDGGGSGVASVEVSTDGGASWDTATGTTAWSYDWTAQADGTHIIRARAIDNMSNLGNPAECV